MRILRHRARHRRQARAGTCLYDAFRARVRGVGRHQGVQMSVVRRGVRARRIRDGGRLSVLRRAQHHREGRASRAQTQRGAAVHGARRGGEGLLAQVAQKEVARAAKDKKRGADAKDARRLHPRVDVRQSRRRDVRGEAGRDLYGHRRHGQEQAHRDARQVVPRQRRHQSGLRRHTGRGEQAHRRQGVGQAGRFRHRQCARL